MTNEGTQALPHTQGARKDRQPRAPQRCPTILTRPPFSAHHTTNPPLNSEEQWLNIKPQAWWMALAGQAALPVGSLFAVSLINNFFAKVAYMNHQQAIQPNGEGSVVW